MQCRICQTQMPEEGLVCPSCQAPVQPPTAPVEQFAEPAPFREYADATIPYQQPPIATPTYSPFATPAPNVVVGGLPPVAPKRPRSRGKVGLILAFVLVIVVSMSTGSLLTYLFMQHRQVTQASNINSSQKGQDAQLDYGSADPQTIYTSVTSKTPINVDPLNDPGTSYWNTSTTCQFKDGSFHVIETKPRYMFACTSGEDYSNFAFQVEINILQGYAGGLTFRDSTSSHTFYMWRMETNGVYRLTAFSRNGTSPVLLEGAHTPYFKSGYNQKNLLTVIAHNSDILLYVNQHYIGRVKDSTYSSGYVGLLSYNGNATTEVSFTNAKTWILS